MTYPGDFPTPDGTTVWSWCWPLSVNGGETVDVHCSAEDPDLTIEVARVGATRDVVWSTTATTGRHALPADADTHGCDWPVTTTVPTDPTWRSGFYEVVTQPAGGGGSEHNRAFFVVRPRPEDRAPILLALGTNTWNAYNDIGGGNTYTGNTQASFRRPITRGLLHKPDAPGKRVPVLGDPDPTMTAHVTYILEQLVSQWSGSAGWPNYEQPFLAWAETEGYEIDVVLNNDLARPGTLDSHRLLLSVGHDEYWTWEMRDAVEAFSAAGGNVAFLSGNTSYWQVRMEDDGATMIAFKQAFEDDPVYGTDRQDRLTSIWSDHLIGRPENTLTGLTFTRGGYHRIGLRSPRGTGGYEVQRPEHWLLEGTGLEYGDQVGVAGTAVGYECDGCAVQIGPDGRLAPTGVDGTPLDLEIVAVAPASPFDHRTSIRPPAADELSEAQFNVWRVHGDPHDPAGADLYHGHGMLTTFVRPGGGTVVNSGCTEWAGALADGDPDVITITRTILDRLG